MNASTPITIDGKTYPKFSLNLAITGFYNPETGQPDASIAMRLVPTKVENEVVETADQAAIGLLRGHLSEIADPAELAAVAAIQTALQTLVFAKGL